MSSNVYGLLSAADDFGQQRVSRKWLAITASVRISGIADVAHTTDSTETLSMLTVPNAASGTLVPSGSRPTAGRSVGKLIPPETALLS
jgi:hypothetical protein